MDFCPQNISLSSVWVNNGLSDCFLETMGTSIIFGFLAVFGGIEEAIYWRLSTRLDTQMLRRPFLFVVQVVLIAMMPLLQLLSFLVEIFLDHTTYGYSILALVLNLLLWPFVLHLLMLERERALPSPPTYRHGLILLIFWALVLIKDCLIFINLHQEGSWFHLKTVSDQVHFALFVLHFSFSICIFLCGLKAPGMPQPQDFYADLWSRLNSEESQPLHVQSSESFFTSRGSTFSGFWRKCKQLVPFIWPKNNALLQLRVIICFVLLGCGRVVNLYVPIYNKKIVNSLSGPVPIFCWDYILVYVVFWFLQGQGGNSFLNNARTFLWIRVQQATVRAVQVELYTHLLGLSLKWHLSRKTGEVLRVMDRGTNSITNLLSYILFNIVPTIVDILVAIVFFSIYFNLWFGLIVLLTMGLYLVATITITEWRTKFRRDMNRLDNATQARGVDALLNFETVKYYEAEQYEISQYEESLKNYQEMEWKSSASLNLLNTAQNVIITCGVLAGTLLCAHLIANNRLLTVGDYVLFSSYLLQLYTPLNHFGTYYRMIQTAFIDMENLFELFNIEPEVKDAPNARSLHINKGEIEFQNVSFSYLPERKILDDVSFVVPAGKKFAIVGPSGSGKSTLVRLLFRFYDVDSGTIFIDGQDISKVTQSSLRRHIGVVPQDTVLFNQDIRYNIRYGKVTASDEEVEKAAEIADIHSAIMNFPKGYNTVVGERGLKLSGGEKQRVAIARTVLKSPQIILLDEATSALDTHTERNIQSALSLVCAGRTSLVIAHRLSTIVDADEILVLKDAHIVERGRHDQLLAHGKVYADMWLTQQQEMAAAEEVPPLE